MVHTNLKKKRTCSGFSPGGIQAYSSRAQPESSSDVEFLWKSNINLFMVFSISRGIAVALCSSRGHLQCRQIFLQKTNSSISVPLSSYSLKLRNQTTNTFPGILPIESSKQRTCTFCLLYVNNKDRTDTIKGTCMQTNTGTILDFLLKMSVGCLPYWSSNFSTQTCTCN